MDNRHTILCLLGPTAVGKTALAVELVQRFPCEIISVDSALIYRGMDIGTAKPDAEVLLLAPHHLINICNPIDSYSAADFCADASQLCADIIQRGRIPLLVGGTMMYFRALQQGLAILPSANSHVRQQLLQQALQIGWPALHQRLQRIDAVSAQKIHPHDSQRIMRALEVYELTQQPMSALLQSSLQSTPFDYVNILLMPAERTWLHERIAERFAAMLTAGLVTEVVDLLQRWSLTPSHPALRTVGYRQVYDYLQGAYPAADLLAKGIAATRQLAKRQLTWLRQWLNGQVLVAEDSNIQQKMMVLVQQILDNR